MPLCENEGKIKGDRESLTEQWNITTFLMKSVYSTSVKVQHQPPLEFSLFFLPVLRCLSWVLLTLAQWGAGCLSPKSGAGPCVGWGISRLLLHHHLSDHVMPVSAPFSRTKSTPRISQPHLSLCSGRGSSLHRLYQCIVFVGSWKTSGMNGNRRLQTSWIAISPLSKRGLQLGCLSKTRVGWTLLAAQVGREKESRHKERFIHQEICGLLLRSEVTSWHLICNAGISVWHQASCPPSVQHQPLSVLCTWIVPLISIGFCQALALWAQWCCCCPSSIQPKRNMRDRLHPLVTPNSH